MKMTDENRTDLPHDQATENNDGDSIRDLRNRENQALGFEESAAGTPPLGMDFNRTADYPEELFTEGNTPARPEGTPPELVHDDDNPIGANPGELNPEERSPERNNREGFLEETAAEVAPAIRRYPTEDREAEGNNEDLMANVETMEKEEASGTVLGWTALVLSIISLFFLPLLTATVGVITGFFAYRTGARALGMWAIAIGLFSIVLGLFIAPFVR
jgi:hypothetical protein